MIDVRRWKTCRHCPNCTPKPAGPCPCLADSGKRDIMVMVTLKLADLPSACPIRTRGIEPEKIEVSPEQAAAEAKRGGCCSGGDNAG